MVLHPLTRKLQQHQIEGNELSNEEYKSHGGDFNVYFRNKQVKLDTQAKETNQKLSGIFSNCVIYITGYTVPSAVELKRLIVENGGQVCAFYGGKGYATHIVATSLTSRKTELFANIKVVKPTWITESVKVGKLLDWSHYKTLQVVGNSVFHTETSIGNEDGILNSEEGDDEKNVNLNETMEPDEPDEHEFYDLLDAAGPEGDAARIKWIQNSRHKVNCMDPDFIRDYFSKSRLHFLTTRKLELRKRCRQYKVTNNLVNNQAPVRRTILHVDFDSFFVAVALSKHEDLKDKPVCVSHGSDGSDIASCNYVARKSGVTNGMWVAQAKKLCPEIICLPYNFEDYTSCSNHLYDIVLGLNPLHVTAVSVDEVIADISNLSDPGHHGVASICQFVRAKVKELTNIDVSVGIGTNILLAKLALKQAKPAGCCAITDPSGIRGFNVRDLPGVGRHTYSQLVQELKVNTLQDLQSVPLVELQSTLGNAVGQKLYGYARGMDTSDVTSLDMPIKTVGLDIGWGVRVTNEDEMSEFIRNCVAELWDRLQKSGTGMEALVVKIYAKSSEAPFVAPKFMGHGLCDITSRSKRIPPRTTFENLKEIVLNMVKSLNCRPLNFRGIGLHMKVSEQLELSVNPNQQFVTDMYQGDRTPSSKGQMVSVPPRKRRHGMTLTQMVTPSPLKGLNIQTDNNGNLDLDVLAALPSQIRKEILLNEDYCNVESRVTSLGPPLYKQAFFMNLRTPSELRKVVRQWVQNSEYPTAEDVQSFWDYISEAAKDDSSWTGVLDLCEWLQYMVTTNDCHPDWHELCSLVDRHVQTLIKARI